MKDMKPLYATISKNGALYGVQYRAEHAASGSTTCNSSGYSLSVFEPVLGSGIPCVDFRTMDFDGYTFPIIREGSSGPRDNDPTLADWLKDVEERGATITTL